MGIMVAIKWMMGGRICIRQQVSEIEGKTDVGTTLRGLC
jgi:hypothetical protein